MELVAKSLVFVGYLEEEVEVCGCLPYLFDVEVSRVEDDVAKIIFEGCHMEVYVAFENLLIEIDCPVDVYVTSADFFDVGIAVVDVWCIF